MNNLLPALYKTTMDTLRRDYRRRVKLARRQDYIDNFAYAHTPAIELPGKHTKQMTLLDEV